MSPFSIIYRYIARNYLITLILCLLILMGLISLFDIIDLLRRTASYPDITFKNVLHLACFKSPQMIHMILPFAVLLSSLTVFWRLTKSSELVIIRASGVSVWNFLKPILLITFLVGVLDITVVNPMTTSMTQRFHQLEERFHLVKSSSLSWSPKGFWLREIRENRPIILRASALRRQEGSLALDDFSVFELKENEILDRQIESPHAVLDKNQLTLFQAWVIEPGKSPQTVPQMQIPTSLSIEKILENFESPDTTSFWKLPEAIEFFDASGFSSLKHRAHFYSLLVSPFYLMIMVLIAAVFCLTPNNRQGKILFKIIEAIVCGFGLFFSTTVMNALGVSQTFPLFLAVLGPALVAVPLCVSLLLHREDG